MRALIWHISRALIVRDIDGHLQSARNGWGVVLLSQPYYHMIECSETQADILAVTKLDRLTRSTADLLTLVRKPEARKVDLGAFAADAELAPFRTSTAVPVEGRIERCAYPSSISTQSKAGGSHAQQIHGVLASIRHHRRVRHTGQGPA